MSLLTKITAKDQTPPSIFPALPREAPVPTVTPPAPMIRGMRHNLMDSTASDVFIVTVGQVNHRGEPSHVAQTKINGEPVKIYAPDRRSVLGELLLLLEAEMRGQSFVIQITE